MIEILPPGNKSSERHLRALVGKAMDCISIGVHLLVADLFPPGIRDPNGIHGEIWESLYSSPKRFQAAGRNRGKSDAIIPGSLNSAAAKSPASP